MLLGRLLLATSLALAQASEAAPSPPASVSQVPINWALLGAVLGSLYLVSMLAVMIGVCCCWRNHQRSTQLTDTPNEVHVTLGVPMTGSAAAHSSPFTSHKVERAGSWREAAQQQGGQAGFDMSQIEKSIKLGFIRKVYSILATQLAITVAIVMGFIYGGFELDANGAPDPMMLTGFGAWVLSNYWVIIVAFVPLLICYCAMHSMKNRYPVNFVLLFIFTVIESITLGFFCLYVYRAGYGAEILLAFGITMAIFCCLTLFTMQSKIDWNFLGPAIFCCLFVLIFWGFFTFWLVPASSFVPRQLFSLFGAIIFCLFIICARSEPRTPASLSSPLPQLAPLSRAGRRHQQDHEAFWSRRLRDRRH